MIYLLVSIAYIHNSADDQIGLTKLFHETAVTSTTDLQPEDFGEILQQQNIKYDFAHAYKYYKLKMKSEQHVTMSIRCTVSQADKHSIT